MRRKGLLVQMSSVQATSKAGKRDTRSERTQLEVLRLRMERLAVGTGVDGVYVVVGWRELVLVRMVKVEIGDLSSKY